MEFQAVTALTPLRSGNGSSDEASVLCSPGCSLSLDQEDVQHLYSITSEAMVNPSSPICSNFVSSFRLRAVLWLLLLLYIAASAVLWTVALFTAACALLRGDDWRNGLSKLATAAVLLGGFLVDAKERASAPARNAVWGFAKVGYGWRVALANLLMMVTFLGLWLEWDARTWVPSRLVAFLDSM